jgi:hypothetical protein
VITPTNRNSAQIADINNKNQVSAWFNFADTVNVSAFSIANKIVNFVITSTYMQFRVICDILGYHKFSKAWFFADYLI